MSQCEEVEAENENDEKNASGISLLLFAMNGAFIMALTTGILVSNDYLRGLVSADQLLARLEEILIYAMTGVALLLIHLARRRYQRRTS